MRFPATLINILAATSLTCLLSSCVPTPTLNGRAELAKLEGPKVGTVDKALENQANQAVSNGDYKRAAQVYKQLSDEHPDDKHYMIALADNLRRSGENDSALKVSDVLLRKYPDDAEALEVKGLSLMNVGEFTTASKTFAKVMKNDKRRWRTLNAIGILFAIKKMEPQAIEYYKAALEINPTNAGILNNLGLAYAMGHQYNECVDAFTRARGQLESGSPELSKIDLNFALAYATFGKLDAAEQMAAPHLSKPGLYNNMGFYAYISKNRDLSKVYLNKALTQDPIYYDRAWKNLAIVNGDNSIGPSGENTMQYGSHSKRVVVNDNALDNGPVSAQDIPNSFGETDPAPAPAQKKKHRKAKSSIDAPHQATSAPQPPAVDSAPLEDATKPQK
ncbi:MAG TPA: tetratricopeptide repeat protein [Rickettsiales bacterium]|nr:tetratricopeptide repeat protein [Rickettsiales bacterium]